MACFKNCVAGLLMIFNALIALASIAVIIFFSVYVYSNDWNELYGGWWVIAALGIMGLICVFSVIGLIAACSRNKCVISLFSVLIVIVFLALLGLGAGSLIMASKMDEYDQTNILHDGWSTFVNQSNDLACDFQSKHSCSGFNVTCADPNPIPEDCPVCEEDPATEPCDSEIEEQMKDNFEVMGYISFGLSAIALVSLVLNIIICRSRDEDDVQRY
eukprot:TRINITY_DN461_c1_g2_i1.p1 TRINITY_DN461_c1_g2~~TRINITY_DN461_c1_g2_i1.p1  ORF type:complete len:216 (-),score=90.11 TRINITY_DN461_c1_g2_i1:135-782(-)